MGASACIFVERSSTNMALSTSNPSVRNHPQIQPLHFSQTKDQNCLCLHVIIHCALCQT